MSFALGCSTRMIANYVSKNRMELPLSKEDAAKVKKQIQDELNKTIKELPESL